MPGLRINAQRAGVSVKAVMAESRVAKVMVMANCLYKVPVTPPKKAIGTKTAQITAVTPTMAPPMPCMALMAALVAVQMLVVHDLFDGLHHHDGIVHHDANRQHQTE